jgi:proteasome lid subunit RPN8/RPN11
MVQGHPVRIDYSAALIEEICAAAVEGLSRMRRGGVEVGGVLFGTHRGREVQILAFRPTSCEHAYGPSFTLSEKDLRAFEELLEAARHDTTLRGLDPIGWYHSHTRSEIFLAEEDLDLYSRYFPEPWQVAMVIRPAQFGPSRVGFFFREVDESVRSEASYLEFPVRPRRRAAPPPPVERPGEDVPARDANHRPMPPAVAPPGNGSELAKEAPPPPPPPSFALMEPRVSWKWIWLVLALCLAMAAGGYTARFVWRRPAAQSLSLRVMDMDGQLLIEWDRASQPVQQASRASFEIQDGEERQVVEMDGDRLREGSITYARRSERVDVRFRVERPGAQPAEEFIRFLGQPPPAKPAIDQAEAIRQRDQLQQQVEQMRADLARKNAQIRRLQQRPARPAQD